MYFLRNFFQLFVYISIIFLFSGCAVRPAYTGAGDPANQQKQYQPQSQEGMTYDAVEETIAYLLSGQPGKFGIKYHGDPGINDFARVEDLSRLFAGGNQTHRFYSRNENNRDELDYVLFSSIPVKDGKIAISPQLAIPLADLTKPIITGKGPREYCYFVNAGPVSFYFKAASTAYKLADMFYTIQKLDEKVIIDDEKRLADFEYVAARYRELTIKPDMSEEQRKLVVQANKLNQGKDYHGAVNLYLKAIDMDPVSYPGAYFNLALLYAQLQRYHKAINYMKQYLMLVPNALDSRSAQDKIYEWEILMK